MKNLKKTLNISFSKIDFTNEDIKAIISAVNEGAKCTRLFRWKMGNLSIDCYIKIRCYCDTVELSFTFDDDVSTNILELKRTSF